MKLSPAKIAALEAAERGQLVRHEGGEYPTFMYPGHRIVRRTTIDSLADWMSNDRRKALIELGERTNTQRPWKLTPLGEHELTKRRVAVRPCDHPTT